MSVCLIILYSDTIYYIDEYFPLRGIRYIAVTDSFDSFLDESGVLVSIINVMNEAHSMDIGKKIKAAKQQIVKSGSYIGSMPPFGYTIQKGEISKLIVDPVVAPLVQEMFRRVSEGETINKIRGWLNLENQLTPSDYFKVSVGKEVPLELRKMWTNTTLKRMLTSEMYLGHIVQGKTENVNRVVSKKDPSEYIIVKNTHPPLVSEEIFEKCQQTIFRREFLHKNVYPPNLFGKHLTCGGCGKKMYRTFVYKKGKNAHKEPTIIHHCCSNKNIHEGFCNYNFYHSILERDLTKTLLTLLESQGEILLGKKLSLMKKEKELVERKKLNAKELVGLDKEIRKKQTYLRGLYENLISGVITEQEYTELRQGYEKEIKELKQQYLIISKKQETFEKEVEDLTSFTSEMQSEEFSLTSEIIDLFFSKIVILEDKKIDVEFNFNFPQIDEVLNNE